MKQDVFVIHYAPGGNKVRSQGQFVAIWKGIISWVCIPNMKFLYFTV